MRWMRSCARYACTEDGMGTACGSLCTDIVCNGGGRQSQAKLGNKDQFVKRFLLHMTNTISAVKKIPSEQQVGDFAGPAHAFDV
jgi:hypothetical protein